MTKTPPADIPATKPGGWTRAAYVATAALALCGSAHVARHGLTQVTKLDAHLYLQAHGLALFGLPVIAFFTTGLVCLMRALDPTFRIDLIGVKADGVAAALICWVLVFGALTVALRGLW
ncbi:MULTISPECIES: hypothetical protein [unclassified Brevundimonas]|jgi:hypothetical protein|uniref:hypothetical protein n=1 Tax=unclassified Brevundimonas TaxID=2622653 RepID=UPI000E9FF892|nr:MULTISPECIES: hypothetical protein [unclassified Brevundimonas]HBY43047.1 hypothetical protein [Brevundimonas sp.]